MQGVERLKVTNIDDVSVFSLKGLVTLAKLVKNYDGDTGDLMLLYKGEVLHMKARFSGYDTCEIKPPLSDPERDMKKKRALQAKKRLWELCVGEDVPEASEHTRVFVVRCGDFDKYGRLLVTAFPQSVCVEQIQQLTDEAAFESSLNNTMILEGHGYAYDGGKKMTSF